MSEKKLIICMPTTVPQPDKAAKKSRCHVCKTQVWIHPTTIQQAARHGDTGIEPVCWECYSKSDMATQIGGFQEPDEASIDAIAKATGMAPEVVRMKTKRFLGMITQGLKHRNN